MPDLTQLKALGRFLAKPHIFFFTVIWLIVIVIVGTVQQKFIGLYEAQRIYFSTFVFWVGPLPLPAGYTALTVVFVNLFCKLVFVSPWHAKRSGTIIAHFGTLLLLLGGLLTAVHSQEGSMYIYEGQTSDQVQDYFAKELVIFSQGDDGREQQVARFDWDSIHNGDVLSVAPLKMSLNVLKTCDNCQLTMRSAGSEDVSVWKGLAAKLDIMPTQLNPKAENNQGGILMQVNGLKDAQDGVYLALDFMPQNPEFQVDGKTYIAQLRKIRTTLPFSIEVKDFVRELHPGTMMAKSYKSEVIVHDGDVSWPYVIQMNQPLRYKGYTFYQSSFVEFDTTEATVLAVVQNAGRLFPYISSSIMCIGLLIHLCLYIPHLIKGRKP